MFWRRRKLAEDEPLVPHGLISQAMEEEGSSELPPDMLDSPKDVKQSPAEPVEMRLRVSAPAQSSETGPLPEQGKISPPLRWPRVDEAEIARRAQGVDTAVSFPFRKPLVSAAVPEPVEPEPEPEPEISEPAKLELVEIAPAIPIRSVRAEKFRNLILRVRDLRLPNLAPFRQRIRRGFTQVKTSASSGVQAATGHLQDVRHKSEAALDAAKLSLVNRSHTALSQSRSGLQHVRENLRSADFSGAGRAWNRMRSWQVTVRIPASNRGLFLSVLETAKASQLRAKAIVERDSRLWASMGMAALSALLALGFISAVRHYGPTRVEAQPMSTQQSTPAKAAQSNLLAASAVNPAAAGPVERKPSPIANSGANKQAAKTSVAPPQKKRVASPSPKKLRVRRNTEADDYVAKDTYVYYGNAGKPSR